MAAGTAVCPVAVSLTSSSRLDYGTAPTEPPVSPQRHKVVHRCLTEPGLPPWSEFSRSTRPAGVDAARREDRLEDLGRAFAPPPRPSRGPEPVPKSEGCLPKGSRPPVTRRHASIRMPCPPRPPPRAGLTQRTGACTITKRIEPEPTTDFIPEQAQGGRLPRTGGSLSSRRQRRRRSRRGNRGTDGSDPGR
jgi:hypothetical protein